MQLFVKVNDSLQCALSYEVTRQRTHQPMLIVRTRSMFDPRKQHAIISQMPALHFFNMCCNLFAQALGGDALSLRIPHLKQVQYLGILRTT
jgi:hypothetical protein